MVQTTSLACQAFVLHQCTAISGEGEMPPIGQFPCPMPPHPAGLVEFYSASSPGAVGAPKEDRALVRRVSIIALLPLRHSRWEGRLFTLSCLITVAALGSYFPALATR